MSLYNPFQMFSLSIARLALTSSSCHATILCGIRRFHFRVAIVGSGPAGFYTAQRILRLNAEARVDIIERLPAPFGLVRYGVAPDHPEVKNVITQFTNLLQSDRCTFYGNVSVGKHLSLQQLLENYTAVVLAYGADADRRLEVPGEDSRGFLSARRFVGWYNGIPDDASLEVDLSSHTAVIVGQGNVAIDVSRILLSPIDLLENTDICDHALSKLRESQIRRVIMVGRRGPLQVAFTIKEFRELLKLKQTTTLLAPEDHEMLAPIIPDLPRGKKRLIELLYDTSKQNPATIHGNRELEIKYLRSPTEINTDEQGKMSSITFEVNKLLDPTEVQSKVKGTGVFETVDCGIGFRSIGYKSVSMIKDVPFDEAKSVVPNMNSRVTYLDGNLLRGLYCSGWIKRGPTGVIASTMVDAYETAFSIQEDISIGMLKGFDDEFELSNILPRKLKVVGYKDWSSVDIEEVSRGGGSKPREKIVSVSEMIDLVSKK